MAGDRRENARGHARKAPYKTEGGSLRERISSGRVSTRDNIERRSANSNDGPKRLEKTKNPDNPLYAYLSGMKPRQRPSPDTKPQANDRQTTAERTSKRPWPEYSDDTTLLRSSRQFSKERQDHDHVNLLVRGVSNNSFSIRGASSTSVSIKNLAPGTTQADVFTILNQQVGEVEHVNTFPVTGGLSVTAEVTFGSRIAAEKAISLLHGVLADNKRLEVTILLIPDGFVPQRSDSPYLTAGMAAKSHVHHSSEPVTIDYRSRAANGASVYTTNPQDLMHDRDQQRSQVKQAKLERGKGAGQSRTNRW